MVDSIATSHVGTVATVQPIKNDEKKQPKKQKKKDENPADNDENSRVGINIDERC